MNGDKRSALHEIVCAICGKKDLRRGSSKNCMACSRERSGKSTHVSTGKPVGRPRNAAPKVIEPKKTFYCLECRNYLPIELLSHKKGKACFCVACAKKIKRSVAGHKANPRRVLKKTATEAQLNNLCRWVNNHGG
jgi:ribosomal protein L44E